MRDLGALRIGFVGLTLKDTGELASPAGTAGYSFADEAQTANALAARLRENGADEIVLLIHEGGSVSPGFNVSGCPSLSGAIVPILEALDPDIRLVISGHTHSSYVCEIPADEAPPRLLTSAGRYGYFVTDISASVDPDKRRFVSLSARNVPVTASAGAREETARLVERYVSASQAVSDRVVGALSGEPPDEADCLERWSENLVADAQLAAAAEPANGGAQLAFINSGGVRNRLEPLEDGSVTFGQLFAMQPFGNRIVVLELTGVQLDALLEQQFCEGESGVVEICRSRLTPSANLAYTFDTEQPRGERIVRLMLDGREVEADARYRLAVNDFLATGGDGFDVLQQARRIGEAGPDIEALESYLGRGGVAIPRCGRVREAD